MSEKVHSVEDASVRLDRSKHQVYRLIQTGQLPAIEERTGRHRFVITESALAAFLAGERSGERSQRKEGALLKASTAARMTGLSVEMIRKLCERGDLAHRRSGNGSGHYYILRESVDEYLSRADY